MAELADASVSKTDEATRVGSSPTPGTMFVARPALGRFSCPGEARGLEPQGRDARASRAERSEAVERCRRQRGSPTPGNANYKPAKKTVTVKVKVQ